MKRMDKVRSAMLNVAGSQAVMTNNNASVDGTDYLFNSSHNVFSYSGYK